MKNLIVASLILIVAAAVAATQVNTTGDRSPEKGDPGAPAKAVQTTQDRSKAVRLEDARRIINAAEKRAREIGQPMNIAVVDEGGNLVAFSRMDNAWLGSIDIAVNKAFTSRAFDIATKDLADLSQPGKQFYGIHNTNDGRIVIFAGGVPLRANNNVVGAIGVSGGMANQDQTVADAGAAAF